MRPQALISLYGTEGRKAFNLPINTFPEWPLLKGSSSVAVDVYQDVYTKQPTTRFSSAVWLMMLIKYANLVTQASLPPQVTAGLYRSIMCWQFTIMSLHIAPVVSMKQLGHHGKAWSLLQHQSRYPLEAGCVKIFHVCLWWCAPVKKKKKTWQYLIYTRIYACASNKL